MSFIPDRSDKTITEPKSLEESDTDLLRASILIGVDKQQQYFFDIQWDYTDIEKTSNDLANLVMGLTYGLFIEQINNLLTNLNTEANEQDRIISKQTISLIKERSIALNKLLNNNSPIIKPSEVFRAQTDVNKTH